MQIAIINNPVYFLYFKIIHCSRFMSSCCSLPQISASVRVRVLPLLLDATTSHIFFSYAARQRMQKSCAFIKTSTKPIPKNITAIL